MTASAPQMVTPLMRSAEVKVRMVYCLTPLKCKCFFKCKDINIKKNKKKKTRRNNNNKKKK